MSPSPEIPPLRSLLPATWRTPEIFSRRLGEQAGRQRLMEADGHLLLVLHAPFKPDEVTRKGRFYWRQPSGDWQSSEFGAGPGVLLRHVNEYAAIVDQYEREELAAQSADDYFRLLSALAPLHRSISHLHKVLQETRERATDDRHVIIARDRAYDLDRQVDLLHQDVKHGLDYAMARRAEEQAAHSRHMAAAAHRLNVLAAFFFPLATLCAIFGVNLQTGLEEAAAPLPFVAVVGAGILIGAAVTLAIISKPPPTAPDTRARPR